MPSPSQLARLQALEAKMPTASKKPYLSGAEVRAILADFYTAIDSDYPNGTFDEHAWVMEATDQELEAWWNHGTPDRPWRDFPRAANPSSVDP